MTKISQDKNFILIVGVVGLIIGALGFFHPSWLVLVACINLLLSIFNVNRESDNDEYHEYFIFFLVCAIIGYFAVAIVALNELIVRYFSH